MKADGVIVLPHWHLPVTWSCLMPSFPCLTAEGLAALQDYQIPIIYEAGQCHHNMTSSPLLFYASFILQYKSSLF